MSSQQRRHRQWLSTLAAQTRQWRLQGPAQAKGQWQLQRPVCSAHSAAQYVIISHIHTHNVEGRQRVVTVNGYMARNTCSRLGHSLSLSLCLSLRHKTDDGFSLTHSLFHSLTLSLSLLRPVALALAFCRALSLSRSRALALFVSMIRVLRRGIGR